MTPLPPSALRADVWLWAARFFKTRNLCRQAIIGGKIEVGGVCCKPARMLRVGDLLHITRGDERFEIKVLGLSQRRGPASVAVSLFAETEASLVAREALREQKRLLAASVQMPARRPSKQERRKIHRFKQNAAAGPL